MLTAYQSRSQRSGLRGPTGGESARRETETEGQQRSLSEGKPDSMPQQVRLHRQSHTVGCTFPFQVAEAGDQERKEPTRESGKSVQQKQRSVSQRTAGPTLLSDSELTEPVALIKTSRPSPTCEDAREASPSKCDLTLGERVALARGTSRGRKGPAVHGRRTARPQGHLPTRAPHTATQEAHPTRKVPQNEVQRKLLFQARESAGRHNTCAVTVTPPSSQTDPAG